MSPRVLILALFFMVGLLPQGWNKFDNTSHAMLLYGLGALIIVLLFLSWKEILKQKMDKEHRFSASNMVKMLGAAFAATLVAAFIASPIQNVGWSEVMVMAAGVGIFFIAQTFSEKERRDFAHLVLGLALAAATLGLAQYIFRSENRIAGPFFDAAFKPNYWPNAFALMILTCWPLALTIDVNKTFELEITKKHIIIFELAAVLKAIAVTMLITALILTFSRAGFLVFILQLIVIAWLVRGTIKSTILQIFSRTRFSLQNRKSLVFTIITAILVITTVSALQFVRTNLTTHNANSFVAKASFAGTEQQTSVLERWQFMGGALKLTLEHPWLGSGPFSFRYIYPKIQPDFLAVSDHPHNWYLKIALEEGVPAALMFIALIAIIFYIRRDIFTQKGITFSAAIALALMGPLVHNLVDYNMNFLTNQILFWTFLGFFVSGKSIAESASTARSATLADLVKASKTPYSTPIWPSVLAAGILFTGTGFLFEGLSSITHHYENTQFSRNHFFDEARHVVSQADAEKGISLMEHHLSLNPYDAYAWNYLGKIQERTDPDKALKSYENAIKSDPANSFNFYINYVKTAKRLNKTNTDTYKKITEKAHAFLLTYPEKVLADIHFTAKSENVPDAIELAKLLDDLKLSLRIKRALQNFRSKHPSVISKS